MGVTDIDSKRPLSHIANSPCLVSTGVLGIKHLFDTKSIDILIRNMKHIQSTIRYSRAARALLAWSQQRSSIRCIDNRSIAHDDKRLESCKMVPLGGRENFANRRQQSCNLKAIRAAWKPPEIEFI